MTGTINVWNGARFRHDSANQKKTLKYLKINDIPERSEAKRTSEASEPNSWGGWGVAVSPPTGSGAEPQKILDFDTLYTLRCPILTTK